MSQPGTQNQMGVFDTMYNCRAMRKLDTREVPEDMLRDLISAANQAPSGSNTQGARWIVVRDPAVKQRLADMNRAGVEAYLAPLIDNPGSLSHQSGDKRKRMVDAVVWQKEHMHEIPALIIACMDFGAPATNDMIARGNGSIWPGIQNLLLGSTRDRTGCCTHHTGSNRPQCGSGDPEPARFYGGLCAYTCRLSTG